MLNDILAPSDSENNSLGMQLRAHVDIDTFLYFSNITFSKCILFYNFKSAVLTRY